MPRIAAGSYLIEILFEIGPAKPAGMSSQIGIDEVDLAAWMANQNVKLKPWECKAIRQLSREYAAMLVEAAEPNCPPPWADKAMFTDEHRAKIASAMSSWADRINSKTR